MFELAVLHLKEVEERDKKRVTAIVVRDIKKEHGNGVSEDGSYSQPVGDEEMNRVWSDVLKAAWVYKFRGLVRSIGQ